MGKQTIPQRDCGVVIIGSGLEALSVVSRLPPSVAQNATVIDPSGEWLHSWNTHCQKLGVTHLRSPITQHPGASPLELRSFIEQQGLEKELFEVVPGHSPVPSAALLLKFCQERIISKLPNSVKHILKDTVVDIQPIHREIEQKNEENENKVCEDDHNDKSEDILEEEEEPSPEPSCILHLTSGRTLPARAVIVACSHCAPVVPTWARGNFQQEYLKTWDQIDLQNPEFREKNIKNKQIVIVGGGMTAALLALGALSHPQDGETTSAATVTLIARRPLLQQPFNCDIGWWGNKCLNAFWQCTDTEYRMKMCRQARYQASITPRVWAALERAITASKIKLIQGYQVESATTTTSKEEASSSNLKTSLKLQVTPTPNIDSTKILSKEQGVTALNSEKSPLVVEGDCVWLACGFAYNIAHHPLLSTIQSQFPTRLIAGYPVLDPATCVWPGAPVYVLGRGAMLAVGPCAGELAGMRLAADRIVKSLKKLDYSGKTEWEAAAEILAPQLKTLPPTPTSTASTEVSTLQPKTVLENYLELEKHGIMCYQRHIKPSLAHPAHLIDISDLPPPAELPRHEIQKFSFSEEDFEISVILQLPEAVPLSSVRSLITERSLEVWAVGTEGMYRLHVPRLYGKVLPSRCKIKVNESRKKVYVVLYKEKDAEWRFLKGI